MSDVMKWLTEVRKLDAVLLEHMGVRATRHSKIGDAVAFPYHRRGEPYAAKYRTVDKKFISTPEVSRGLYNEDSLRAQYDLPIVITEGEVDCLSVLQSGSQRVVSLPDGWGKNGNKSDVLVGAEDLLRKSPHVIVAGDNDEAGESLPRAVANILRGHDVRYVTWPDGCKDANDVLVRYGEPGVVKAILEAKPLDPEGGMITGFSDLPPTSARRVLRTGVAWVDRRVAFEVGTMSVATGTPGVGKSTFTTWLMHLVTAHENVRCGMMAFETHPHLVRDHLTRLAAGKPFDEIDEAQQATVALDLDKRFRLVHRTFSDDRAHNLGWLEEMIYTLAIRDGCKIIVVDPWNELEHIPATGESLTAYINYALLRIRQLAQTLETHICVVAHPRKMDESQRRPPRGYDIADSAAFYNKPSLGFTVHADKSDSGEVYNQVITWKVRDVQLYGILKGVTDCTFQQERMDYVHRSRSFG
jgi:twinkle protein